MTVSEISDFQAQLKQGIPDVLPPVRPRDESVSHAPRRKQILTPEEERLALRNALRYFPQKFHAELAPEFVNELRTYGRIYMYDDGPDCSGSSSLSRLPAETLRDTFPPGGHTSCSRGGNGTYICVRMCGVRLQTPVPVRHGTSAGARSLPQCENQCRRA